MEGLPRRCLSTLQSGHEGGSFLPERFALTDLPLRWLSADARSLPCFRSSFYEFGPEKSRELGE